MGIKSYNPYTPSRRHMTEISYRVFKEKRWT